MANFNKVTVIVITIIFLCCEVKAEVGDKIPTIQFYYSYYLITSTLIFLATWKKPITLTIILPLFLFYDWVFIGGVKEFENAILIERLGPQLQTVYFFTGFHFCLIVTSLVWLIMRSKSKYHPVKSVS